MDSSQDSKGSGHRWWHWLIMYPTLLVGLIGAIPQYGNWLNARRLDVPASKVSAALEQEHMWQEGLDCARRRGDVTRAHGVTVETVVCPSGNVLLRLQEDDRTAYHWVAFGTGPEADRHSLLSLGGSVAHAQPRPPARDDDGDDEDPHVVCIERIGKGQVLRRLKKPDGRCIDERINTFRGSVKRSSAACDPDCKR